jgi:hypothetical protein
VSVLSLEEALGQLPAFRASSEALARDAMNGRHLLVLTGGQVEPSILRMGLEEALARLQGPVPRTVPLAECGTEEDLAAFLARVTGLDEEQLRPASGARGLEGFQSVHELLWLEGLEQLPEPEMTRWLHFFRLWALYGRAAAHVFALPLRRRAPALSELVSDTRLALHHWWGRLSLLDMQMLCRLGEPGPVGAPQSLWREAVLPHLVDGSASLARKLWEVVLQPEPALLAALAEHAREQRLEPAPLREAVRKLGRHRSESGQFEAPPAAWQTLWEMGAAQSCAEHGPELTAVALALLDDMPAVRNRLWRGQATLLLPRLTRLRIAICQALTDKHGRSWPLRLGAAFMDEEQRRRVAADPLATEFGPLEYILQRRPEAGGQRYLALVQRAREMRNLLAHNQPVSFGDFEGLHELQQRLGLGNS